MAKRDCAPCQRARKAQTPNVPKPQVKFEVATTEGVKKFDTVDDAQKARRPGAMIRTVRG